MITPTASTLDRVIDVSLDRPRVRNSPGFLILRAELLDVLHFASHSEMGDLPEKLPVADENAESL